MASGLSLGEAFEWVDTILQVRTPKSTDAQGEKLTEPSGHDSHTPPAPTAHSVLYVAGEGRSGSTIVARVLGDNSNAVDVGELRNLWERGVIRNERCGCGAQFGECPFWSEVGQEAFGGWDSGQAEAIVQQGKKVARHRFGWATIVRTRFRRPAGAEHMAWAQAHARVYTAIAQVSGSEIIVDSSKEPAFAAAVAQSGLTDIKVLHLVRDPRGVAHSHTRRKVRHEAAGSTRSDSAPVMPQLGAVRTSVAWTLRNLQSQALQLVAPYIRQRYETWTLPELSAREAEISGRLGVGLAGGHEVNDSGRKLILAASHSVSGNPSRFERGSAVELKSDDAWRHAPRSKRRALVSLLTFPMRLSYRYIGGA